jgi:hypothetical protein
LATALLFVILYETPEFHGPIYCAVHDLDNLLAKSGVAGCLVVKRVYPPADHRPFGIDDFN